MDQSFRGTMRIALVRLFHTKPAQGPKQKLVKLRYESHRVVGERQAEKTMAVFNSIKDVLVRTFPALSGERRRRKKLVVPESPEIVKDQLVNAINRDAPFKGAMQRVAEYVLQQKDAPSQQVLADLVNASSTAENLGIVLNVLVALKTFNMSPSTEVGLALVLKCLSLPADQALKLPNDGQTVSGRLDSILCFVEYCLSTKTSHVIAFDDHVLGRVIEHLTKEIASLPIEDPETGQQTIFEMLKFIFDLRDAAGVHLKSFLKGSTSDSALLNFLQAAKNYTSQLSEGSNFQVPGTDLALASILDYGLNAEATPHSQ